jgi:lipoprotein Spr
MKVCRNLILPFLVMSFLSACSLFKHTQTAVHETATPADTSSDLAFIDGISIQRNSHPSSQRVNGYHSPEPKVATGSLTATALQEKYAQILEVSSGDIDDTELFSFIDSWWGTPYRYGGDSRSGIDCSAFVQALYAAVFGITTIPRTAQEQYDDSKKIKHISRLKEGDLVFFRIRSRHISHVGIYLQNDKFVHASFSSGVMISDLNDHYWRRYFAGGGEPREATHVNSLAIERSPEK